MKRLLIALLWLVGLPAVSSAQTVVNPTTVQFAPSVSQGTIDPVTGLPAVSSYTLTGVAQVPQGALGFSIDLGLPTPDPATNQITVKPSGLLTIATGVQFVATVAAVGPGGTSLPSNQSNPFGRPAVPAAVPGTPAVR